MIKAQFFDGKTAKAREATVSVYGPTLVLQELESKAEYSFAVSELDITKSTDEIVLSHGDVQIHVSPLDFSTLNIKTTFFGKEKRPLTIAVSVAAVVLILLYFTHKPVIKFLAYQLPDDLFASQTGMVTNLFAQQHCISKAQEESMNEIFSRLGRNYSDYKVYVISEENPNAFAFPGNVIVVHDGLLKKVSGPDALAGILAHEIAHIEGKHVNIALVKNFMIETFWAFTFNKGTISGIAKNFSQGFFSQEQERDADQAAAEMLKDQHIDPKGIAEFFQTLEKEEQGYLKYLVLTHPPYPNRIETFSEVYDTTPVLSETSWKALKVGCSK